MFTWPHDHGVSSDRDPQEPCSGYSSIFPRATQQVISRIFIFFMDNVRISFNLISIQLRQQSSDRMPSLLVCSAIHIIHMSIYPNSGRDLSYTLNRLPDGRRGKATFTWSYELLKSPTSAKTECNTEDEHRNYSLCCPNRNPYMPLPRSSLDRI